MTTAPNPSFATRFHSFLRVAYAMKTAGGEHPALRYEWDKGRHRELAESLGVRHARLLSGPENAETLPEPDAEACFVKPIRGTIMIGCLALVREGARWRSLFDDSLMTWDQVRAHLARVPKWRGPFFAEEMLGPPGEVMDWKFYAFDGDVPLVYQESHPTRTRSTWKRKFWRVNGDRWTPLGGAGLYHGREVDDSLPPPKNPRELIEIADRVSSAVASPFVRVDCYETRGGIVALGEVSMTMGRPQIFTPSLDLLLGTAWESAEIRRLLRSEIV